MSPVRTAEHHVTQHDREDDDHVAVAQPRRGPVTVTWFCGDSVAFDKDGLAEAIANVDRVKGFGQINLRLKDQSGREFHVRVVDGELYADWGQPSGEGRHVSWEELRKVLRKAL